MTLLFTGNLPHHGFLETGPLVVFVTGGAGLAYLTATVTFNTCSLFDTTEIT